MFLYNMFFSFSSKVALSGYGKVQANLYFVPFALANVFLVVALFVVRCTNF